MFAENNTETAPSGINNPFGESHIFKDFCEDTSIPVDIKPVEFSDYSVDGMTDALLKMSKNARAAERSRQLQDAISVLANKTASLIREGVRILVSMAREAVKMAAFKFAIEFCALSIKSLIEAMLSLKMTPPNIDTTGVFYNPKGFTAATAPAQPSSVNGYRTTQENPFGSPFSSPTGW